MQVIQSTVGTFHHFDLARELYSRECLKKIYSTFPWSRLKREGLPREYVSTFPWMHMVQLGVSKYLPVTNGIWTFIYDMNGTVFDNWLHNKIEPCDAYVGLSGAGIKTALRAQELGAKYVCDRGSTHIRFQHDILLEEYARWNVTLPTWSQKAFERHEAEYAAADAITLPSEFCRKTFIHMGVPAEKLKTIPYGVRLNLFHPTGQPPQDAFHVLFVGQVGFRKGVPYLLEAFRKLKHPNKKLRMIGSVIDEFRPFLSTQNLENVEIMGIMPQSSLKEVMSTSHVLVMPSIEEGLALVQGQAMACGCPLISTENSGAEDLITHGREGLIVEARNTQAIADALQQLADDPDLRQRMGHAALERTKSMGGWHQYGENYTNFLKQLLQ